MLLFFKNLVFTVLVPGTVAGWGPYWVLTSSGRPLPQASTVLLIPAVVLMGLGLSIYLWCVWDFAISGRGTPAPIDPPKQLVVRGLYRYVRNPIYLGVLAVIAGWAALFASLAVVEYAIVVALGFHVFVLGVEEPTLKQKFGPTYVEYCGRVSRWWPKVPGKPPN